MRKLADPASPDDSSQSTGEARPRVLYVEDEKDNYDVLAYRLADRYTIVWAETDRQAIELLCEHGDDLYAVLMDIQLMGSAMDGIELTRAIRGIGSVDSPGPAITVMAEIPIIFLTGYISRYSREELAQAGGNALLGKPVDFRELVQALGELGKARLDGKTHGAPAE